MILSSEWKMVIYGIVYFYGIFIGHYFINGTIKFLWDEKPQDTSNPKYKEPYYIVQSSILGMVERSLYILTLNFIGYPFIVLWITLKTVSNWDVWKTEYGRGFFNIFLIGNGLSLLFSFCSYLVIKVINFYYRVQCIPIIAYVLLPILTTIILQIYLYIKLPRKSNSFCKTFYSCSMKSSSKLD